MQVKKGNDQGKPNHTDQQSITMGYTSYWGKGEEDWVNREGQREDRQKKYKERVITLRMLQRNSMCLFKIHMYICIYINICVYTDSLIGVIMLPFKSHRPPNKNPILSKDRCVV